MLRFVLTASAVFALAGATFAAPAAKAKPAPLICPVTGETIASVKAAAGSSIYKGKTYYFCCSDCKPAFDKNPAKYVKSASAARKGQAH